VGEEDKIVASNIRSRAERCRRLAAAITDDRARGILLTMAEEMEADLARLSAGSPDETSKPS
jgi:hypothetical protein